MTYAPSCDVCGVFYVDDYSGPCQEPRPPYDGSRTCPGKVSTEATLTRENRALRAMLDARGVTSAEIAKEIEA